MIKRSSWALPYLIFMIFFVALPLVLILVYALQDGSGNFSLENVLRFFSDSDAIATFALSLEVAIENTVLCILIGYPAAWILANKKYNRSAVTIILFILPMWINALMRTLATAELFNVLGIRLGKGTLLFGMVYDYLPYMILPLYTVLSKMDPAVIEAAEDLGSSKLNVLTRVIMPLSLPGVASGFTMVFVPSVSTFYISQKLGGTNVNMIGDSIESLVKSVNTIHLGAMLSLVLMVVILICIMLMNRFSDESDGGGIVI